MCPVVWHEVHNFLICSVLTRNQIRTPIPHCRCSCTEGFSLLPGFAHARLLSFGINSGLAATVVSCCDVASVQSVHLRHYDLDLSSCLLGLSNEFDNRIAKKIVLTDFRRILSISFKPPNSIKRMAQRVKMKYNAMPIGSASSTSLVHFAGVTTWCGTPTQPESSMFQNTDSINDADTSLIGRFRQSCQVSYR